MPNWIDLAKDHLSILAEMVLFLFYFDNSSIIVIRASSSADFIFILFFDLTCFTDADLLEEFNAMPPVLSSSDPDEVWLLDPLLDFRSATPLAESFKLSRLEIELRKPSNMYSD